MLLSRQRVWAMARAGSVTFHLDTFRLVALWYSRMPITIRGPSVSEIGQWGVDIVNFSQVTLEDLVISHCGASSQFAQGSSDCWARRITINNTNDFGFTFSGGGRGAGIR